MILPKIVLTLKTEKKVNAVVWEMVYEQKTEKISKIIIPKLESLDTKIIWCLIIKQDQAEVDWLVGYNEPPFLATYHLARNGLNQKRYFQPQAISSLFFLTYHETRNALFSDHPFPACKFTWLNSSPFGLGNMISGIGKVGFSFSPLAKSVNLWWGWLGNHEAKCFPFCRVAMRPGSRSIHSFCYSCYTSCVFSLLTWRCHLASMYVKENKRAL